MTTSMLSPLRLTPMAIGGELTQRQQLNRHGATLAILATLFLLLACSTEPTQLDDLAAKNVRSVERSVGFDGEVVRLGVIADITGPGASLDRSRIAGVSAYWADVNAQGGIGRRYAVELEIIDHQGDPQIAENSATELLERVVAFAFINETAMGALHPFLVAQEVLGVAASSTLDWEQDARFLTHGPPIELITLALFENEPQSRWCLITDDSPLGTVARKSADQAATLAGVASVTSIQIGEDLATAVSAAACEVIWAEVAEENRQLLISTLPSSVRVIQQAGLTGVDNSRPDLKLAYTDSGPAWKVDASQGMRMFLSALLRHAPDIEADTRARDGYVSQIRLHQLLEKSVNRGDLRRANIFTASQSQSLIKMDGLAENIDISLEEPILPRSITVRAREDDLEADERGWTTKDNLRPRNASLLIERLRD